MQNLRPESSFGQNRLKCFLTFALPDYHPFVLWKMQIENGGISPIRLEKMDLLHVGGGNHASQLVLSDAKDKSDLAFHSQGWQSWAWTATYGSSERSRRTRMPFLQVPMVANPGTPQPRMAGHFSSDFFGVIGDRNSHSALLVGFLSQCTIWNCRSFLTSES